MNLKQAKQLNQGDMIYHITKTNADNTPMRAKVTSIKTWKRSPDRVEVRVKRGLYDYATFTETDLDQISISENVIHESDFTRVKNDGNGNPRYALHFISCNPDQGTTYQETIKLMNKIGGRKFHNKQYGGGIVFQSYNLAHTIKAIHDITGR